MSDTGRLREPTIGAAEEQSKRLQPRIVVGSRNYPNHLHPIALNPPYAGNRLTYGLYPTALGWIGILGSARGLRRLVLPQPTAKDALHLLLSDPPEALSNDPQFLGLWYRIRDYLLGGPVDFSTEPLDLSGHSAFQRTVWGILRSIPCGETRTYKWVAGQAGRPNGARAVGQAVGANPLPIVIPCHRVVAAGGLGGFSGGLDLKRTLLDLEAAHKIPTAHDA